MGLLKNNTYLVKGIELSGAYAKITRLYIECDDNAVAYFGISTSRSNIDSGNYIDEFELQCKIDKSKNIYEQLYNEAKKELFKDWIDDIVEVEEDENAGTPEAI